MKYIGELPASDKPWRMAACGETVLLANPDHGVYYTEGKQLKKLTYDAVVPTFVMKVPTFNQLPPRYWPFQEFKPKE